MDYDLNRLLEKISSLVETLERYVSGLSEYSISNIEWFTLGAALLAVLASILSIIVTLICDINNRKLNEKLAMQAQAAEDKRANAAIDANLTANARIEWIQNIRRVTTELIASCYSYIKIEKPTLEDQGILQERKTLFSLYFGPDDDNSTEVRASDLLDRQTNKGKNDLIVKHVDNLINVLVQYYDMRAEIKRKEQRIINFSSCYEDGEDGEFIPMSIPKNEHDYYDEKECKNEIERLREEIEKDTKWINQLFNDIDKLSEMIRIYGKIEWNRAKEGK